MARLVGPRVEPRIGPDVSPRPLPRSVVDVFALPEADFTKLAGELERDERFTSLVDKGVLQRVRVRGRIPQHKYEEYMDEELVRFFKDGGITEHDDWQRDFFDAEALGKRHALARKYGVSVGRLVPILRYCRYLNDLSAGSRTFAVSLEPSAPDFLSLASRADTWFDTAPLVERIGEFVERHGLTREQFRDLFFAREPDVGALVERLGASLPEVQAVVDLVKRLQVLNAYQLEMARPGPSRPQAGRDKVPPVAEFVRGPGEFEASVRFTSDDVYDVKYRFDVDREAAAELSREDLEFIDRLKAMNQRKNLLCRIVLMLFRHQYRFVLSGDPLDLEPLKQTEAARRLDEEEASLSRLIRDKFVRLPDGRQVPLKALFRKAGAVVADLVNVLERSELEAGRRSRPFTDVELQQLLKQRYGVALSRRSITYHRNRTMKGANYYARLQRIPKKG